MKPSQALGLVAGLAVLLVALGAQVRSWSVQPQGKGAHLGTLVPADLAGQRLPLGATEASTPAVARELKLDDWLHRGYQQPPAKSYSLFAVYWEPGRREPTLLDEHSPDICWPAAGWRCLQRSDDFQLRLPGDETLWPAYWRKYQGSDGREVFVAFWYLVGGAPFQKDKEPRVVLNPLKFLQGSGELRGYYRVPNEHYFVRVTSEVPFETLAGDAAFVRLLRGLKPLGLFRP